MSGAYWAHSARLRPAPTKLHTWLRNAAVDGGTAAASHSRTVPSLLPEAKNRPFRVNATLSTDAWCPDSAPPSCWPDRTSHRRTMSSVLPEASVWPSGLNASARIRFVSTASV